MVYMFLAVFLYVLLSILPSSPFLVVLNLELKKERIRKAHGCLHEDILLVHEPYQVYF
jgi:hypothetical protein